MVITRLGKRYAKSLLDLAKEMGVLEEVRADIEKILSTLDSSRDLRLLMKSPVVKPEKKVTILREIFDNELHEMTSNFIEIITRKGRESSLENIARGFVDLYRVHKSIAMASVTTAIALTNEQRADIKKHLTEAVGKEIQIEEKVDPTLIGGMRLRVGDRQYDGTISGKLEALKRQFKDNLYVPEF